MKRIIYKLEKIICKIKIYYRCLLGTYNRELGEIIYNQVMRELQRKEN